MGRIVFVLLGVCSRRWRLWRSGLGLTLRAGGAAFIVSVGDDGKPRPLPLDDFRNAMAVLMNAQDTRQDARKEGDRKAFLDRIEAAKGRSCRRPRPRALAANLLRAARG